MLDARGLSYGEFLVAMAVREIAQPTHSEVGDRLDMSKSLVSQSIQGAPAFGSGNPFWYFPSRSVGGA
jgi:hypothetical protein